MFFKNPIDSKENVQINSLFGYVTCLHTEHFLLYGARELAALRLQLQEGHEALRGGARRRRLARQRRREHHLGAGEVSTGNLGFPLSHSRSSLYTEILNHSVLSGETNRRALPNIFNIKYFIPPNTYRIHHPRIYSHDVIATTTLTNYLYIHN